MIIRVQGSGQYRLEDGAVAGLNQLDNELLKAVEKHDEADVTSLLYKMIAYVQSKGEPLGAEELATSDAILPPSGMTYAEVVNFLKEDGLIPG